MDCVELESNWSLLRVVGWLGLVGAVAAGGCSFDSGLSNTQCSEAIEGERIDGQVCRNGYWVEAPADVGVTDAEQPDGDRPDTEPPRDGGPADAGSDVEPDPDADGGMPGDARDGGDADAVAPCDRTPPAEGCPCDHGDGLGVCSEGTMRESEDTGEVTCHPPATHETDENEGEGPPVCDGLDNDCDGTVDEGCPCFVGGEETGVCRNGTLEAAEDGQADNQCGAPDNYLDAEESEYGSDENAAGLCDGLDNDCDGEIDEGCECSPGEEQPCGTLRTEGICTPGTQECQEDGTWGTCENAVVPTAESDDCNNGTDDDCDGTVDEGCPCDYTPTSGDGTQGEGVCSDGTWNDAASGTEECTSAESYTSDEDGGANPDQCDNRDNDCDGVVDEGCSCQFIPTSPDGTQGTGVCANSTVDPDASSTDNNDCAEPSEYIDSDGEAAAGECDGLDNDCDGVVDEGCPCYYENSTDGVCVGQTIDSNGDCQQPGNYYAGESGQCAGQDGYDDGLDNDCDGRVDEALNDGGDTCGDDCECPDNQCNDSDGTDRCAHRIFVTSEYFEVGDFSSLAGAHDECQRLAEAEGLGGTWRAILSDGSNDADGDVITLDAGVVRLGDFSEIASTPSDFWSDSHGDEIARDETGTSQWDDSVWTGSDFNGAGSGDHCNNWTYTGPPNAQAPQATNGSTSANDGSWADDGEIECEDPARLYCIDGQQPHP